MLKIAAVAMAVCLAGVAVADEYVVRNMRASKLLGIAACIRSGPGRLGGTATVLLANGGSSLIPEGVTVRADDESGKLSIEGPQDKVDELVGFFKMFDIRPRTVHVAMDISCAADKYSGASSFDVPNNTTHGVDDGVLGLRVSVSPRINDDGTITVHLEADQAKGGIQTVVRCKPGTEQVFSLLGKDVEFRSEVGVTNGKPIPASPERIFVRLKLTIAEDAPRADHRPG